MKKINYGLGTAVGIVMLEIQSGDDSPMLKNSRCRVFIVWRCWLLMLAIAYPTGWETDLWSFFVWEGLRHTRYSPLAQPCVEGDASLPHPKL
jgi:hypothetical protein